ncbi:MAG: oligosaccharide flippase family protein [Dysgonamonadaceae bacterium]|jgi:O-antigen/teichoic acid export membrane protein|nr:oligosaccharide flippase family protein [Dysgonamonadaceae bacterium]
MGNNKRIAKNTLLLYLRLFFSMIISLYTSRIVLHVLGIDDFGIYNVVGGVVMLLGFLNHSMLTATQRFLNYEMGKENQRRLPDIFSTSLTGHYLIALIILVLSETAGLWMVYHFLVIPPERFQAALWVYHFSVFVYVINIVTLPYNAVIIAHERMGVYAVLSITDVASKLAIACLISLIVWDKLQLYAVLLFAATLIVRFIYVLYCKKNFPECSVRFLWDTGLLKKIFSFSGWMLLGTLTNTLSEQGVTIVMNQFFAPVHNAARALAQQVSGVVHNFVANFMLAVHPPIVQSYSRNETAYMYRLVFLSSKISFYLLFIMVLPILLQTEYLLNLWLGKIPEHSVLFTQLALAETLITPAYASIAAVSQASGKIKYYQLIISAGFLLIFGLTYFFYYWGFPAETTYFIAIGIAVAGLFARLLDLRKTVGFPVRDYLFKVILRLMVTVACAVIFPVLYMQIPADFSLLNFICIATISIFSISLFFWLFGLSRIEKQLLIKGIKKQIYEKKNND